MAYTLIILTMVRMILAAAIPPGNDEVYYWDWGRDLKWSYFDHPPGVSWLAAGSSAIFPADFFGTRLSLAVRGLTPLVHLCASLLLYSIYKRIAAGRRSRKSDLAFIAMSQLTPAFGLGGFFLLPDTGLILFSTAGLLFCWKLSRRKNEALFSQGILAGIIAGGAGLFKYHAAPIFAGMYLGLATSLWAKFRNTKRALAFTAATILSGLLVTLPVWIWNSRNDWISITFQANRGISGASIDFPRALRTLAGEWLLLSPGFFALFVVTLIDLWRRNDRHWDRILLWSTLPLLALLHLTSFYKEVLPHWSMPAFWLLIPNAALLCGVRWSGRKLALHASVGMFIATLIAAPAAMPFLRDYLVESMKGRPGALGELTFWPDFVSKGHASQLMEKAQVAIQSNQEKLGKCSKGFKWASFRWFTTAHIAWSLPDQPMVLSFEKGNRYYYADRDRNIDLSGCPVIAIGEKSHAQREIALQHLEVKMEGEIVLNEYQDRPLIWYAGTLR